jgi:hypothetical protein
MFMPAELVVCAGRRLIWVRAELSVRYASEAARALGCAGLDCSRAICDAEDDSVLAASRGEGMICSPDLTEPAPLAWGVFRSMEEEPMVAGPGTLPVFCTEANVTSVSREIELTVMVSIYTSGVIGACAIARKGPCSPGIVAHQGHPPMRPTRRHVRKESLLRTGENVMTVFLVLGISAAVLAIGFFIGTSWLLRQRSDIFRTLTQSQTRSDSTGL